MNFNWTLVTLLTGCVHFMVAADSGGSATEDPYLESVATDDANSTIIHNETVLEEQQGIAKSKVKNAINQVKNKMKEIGGGPGQIGGGNWRHRFRHRSKSSGGSSDYETSTVLWIVFGTIGGSVLIIAVYFGFRAYNQSQQQVEGCKRWTYR